MMVNLSVLYPHKDGARFDMDYYLTKHMALVRERCGAAVKSMSVEQGLAGLSPNSPPAFVVVTHLGFDSLAEFQSAVGPHSAEIMADIPNFTNIEPTLQFSEVKM
jgi:uncharacterized protein (TIGR02118 family)